MLFGSGFNFLAAATFWPPEESRMNAIRRSALGLLALLVLTCSAMAALPRYPNLRNGMIVFVADGNLWQVPRTGGTAQRLTSDPGQDVMPRYS